MGYRSDVLLLVDKKVWEEALNDCPSVKDDVTDITNSADVKKEEDNILLFYWECIKWYDDDAGVMGIQKVMMNFDKPDDYLFIRLGENPDDTEEEGGMYNNPFDAQIFREISFNGKDD